MTTTESTASSRQEQLLELLACPHCRLRLDLTDAVVRPDGVAAGDLLCATHGRVGVIDRHRPSFLDRELEVLPPGSAATRLSEVEATGDMVSTSGRWWSIPEGWAGAADDGVALSVSGEFRSVTFELLCDDWSPIVEVLLDGDVRERLDLSDTSGRKVLSCAFEKKAERSVVLRVVESKPSGRLIVADTRVEVGSGDHEAPGYDIVDRGNPYPPGFIELLNAAPPDAVVLDCGGGDRRLGDPRVFNLEYLPYEAPDLYGDGLALPFPDQSFDLILSQAVLEHVPDPQAAVDEMHRILRPGGRIYCEIAFTQPLHAVPSHYFNVTPHGAEHLFQNWEIEVLDWFGGASATVEWWMQLLELERRWDEEKLATMRSLLTEVDGLTSHEQLRYFASGVLTVATRRGA